MVNELKGSPSVMGPRSLSIPRLLTVLGAMALALMLNCTSAVEPPPEPPRIDSSALRVGTQVVFMLKTLRTLHDVREVTERLSLTPAHIDTSAPAVRLWSVDSVSEAVVTGMAKRAAAPNSPYRPLELALARSRSAITAAPVVYTDSLIQDSLSGPSSQFINVYGIPAGELSAEWQHGWDSLFLRSDTVTVDTVALVRFRRDSTADTIATDRQQWVYTTEGGWQLSRRTQEHVIGGETLYVHTAAVINAVIHDTLTVRSEGAVAQYVLAREDKSSEWWNSLDGSALSVYRDSVAAGDSTTRRTLRGADADDDPVVLDFTDSDTQHVVIRTVRGIAPGKTSEAETELMINLSAGTYDLRTFTRTVVRQDLDSSTYTLSKIDPDTGEAKLVVKVIPLRVTFRDSTAFGVRSKSEYAYTIGFSDDWQTLTYYSFYRIDELRDADSIASVEWESPRSGTTPFDPQTSALSVRLNYALGHQITRFKEWRRPAGTPDSLYRYLWVGLELDSVEVVVSRTTEGYEYNYTKPTDAGRRGVIVRTADSAQLIVDTLRESTGGLPPVRRIVAGTVREDFPDTLRVTGIDTFTIHAIADTLITVIPGGAAPPLTDAFSWSLGGTGGYQAVFDDTSLGLRYTYLMRPGDAGVIVGECEGVDSLGNVAVSAENIQIGVLGSGNADLGGVVTGIGDDDVRVWLRINLWGLNNLNNEYGFY